MIILKIILAIIIIAACVGAVALVIELFTKTNCHKPYGPYERFIKRGLDAFLATGAIIVLSPLLLFVAFIVRVKLGSPVLFAQERPGRDGKIFKLYKFRSMLDRRDENGDFLPDEQRITKFGQRLRATSLDELPELINIIKGEMAVVGPRPLLVEYLTRYNAHQARRHDVRPGFTGLAQVHGRNSISWEEKFDWDVKYVNHITLKGDIIILLETVRIVIKREGISGENTVTMSDFLGNKE